mgnify:CR=1 FL=1
MYPISLTEAAEKLREFRVSRVWLRGFFDGRGITLPKVGASFLLYEEHFEMARDFLSKTRPQVDAAAPALCG